MGPTKKQRGRYTHAHTHTGSRGAGAGCLVLFAEGEDVTELKVADDVRLATPLRTPPTTCLLPHRHETPYLIPGPFHQSSVTNQSNHHIHPLETLGYSKQLVQGSCQDLVCQNFCFGGLRDAVNKRPRGWNKHPLGHDEVVVCCRSWYFHRTQLKQMVEELSKLRTHLSETPADVLCRGMPAHCKAAVDNLHIPPQEPWSALRKMWIGLVVGRTPNDRPRRLRPSFLTPLIPMRLADILYGNHGLENITRYVHGLPLTRERLLREQKEDIFRIAVLILQLYRKRNMSAGSSGAGAGSSGAGSSDSGAGSSGAGAGASGAGFSDSGAGSSGAGAGSSGAGAGPGHDTPCGIGDGSEHGMGEEVKDSLEEEVGDALAFLLPFSEVDVMDMLCLDTKTFLWPKYIFDQIMPSIPAISPFSIWGQEALYKLGSVYYQELQRLATLISEDGDEEELELLAYKLQTLADHPRLGELVPTRCYAFLKTLPIQTRQEVERRCPFFQYL